MAANRDIRLRDLRVEGAEEDLPPYNGEGSAVAQHQTDGQGENEVNVQDQVDVDVEVVYIVPNVLPPPKQQNTCMRILTDHRVAVVALVVSYTAFTVAFVYPLFTLLIAKYELFGFDGVVAAFVAFGLHSLITWACFMVLRGYEVSERWRDTARVIMTLVSTAAIFALLLVVAISTLNGHGVPDNASEAGTISDGA